MRAAIKLTSLFTVCALMACHHTSSPIDEHNRFTTSGLVPQQLANADGDTADTVSGVGIYGGYAGGIGGR